MVASALRQEIAIALAHVRARRPTVKWDAAELEGSLVKTVADSAQLATLHLDDLFLARAAVAGDRAALETLENEILAPLRGVLLRIRASSAFVDDGLQEIRQKLLVGPPPRLSAYGGRGPLKGWVRALAAGTGLDLVRKEKPTAAQPDDDVAAIELNAAAAGVDIDLLKARHGKQLSAALKGAMAALTAQERTVLRMHFIDGLTREEIGTFFKVHRTTALRWLEKAQATLLERTRAALQSELSLSPAELDSLIRYLESGVGQSILKPLHD